MGKRALLVLGALATIGACSGPPPERPLRWQLVERRYGDLEDGGVAGDGRVDPDATVLVFEALFPEELETEIFVAAHPGRIELLDLSHREARVGVAVTARVRVRDGDSRGLYRLTARPSTDFVRIVGQDRKSVRGREPAAFTFTSSRAGRGGLEVAVERID